MWGRAEAAARWAQRRGARADSDLADEVDVQEDGVQVIVREYRALRHLGHHAQRVEVDLLAHLQRGHVTALGGEDLLEDALAALDAFLALLGRLVGEDLVITLLVKVVIVVVVCGYHPHRLARPLVVVVRDPLLLIHVLDPLGGTRDARLARLGNRTPALITPLVGRMRSRGAKRRHSSLPLRAGSGGGGGAAGVSGGAATAVVQADGSLPGGLARH